MEKDKICSCCQHEVDMMLNQNKPIDEDTLGYLAYILCEPARD